MGRNAAGVAAFGAAMILAPAAHAGVSAIHVGVMHHNICITNCKNADKEGSPNVEFQVSFDSPRILRWAGAPQPFVMASFSTTGDTSFGGAGLEWRWQASEHWAIEPGVGYVVHNGVINNKYANGTSESLAYSNRHVLFGSRDLFRTSLSVTYSTQGPWEVQATFEHLSHGQILGNGRNQGTDELGLRLGYRFGG